MMGGATVRGDPRRGDRQVARGAVRRMVGRPAGRPYGILSMNIPRLTLIAVAALLLCLAAPARAAMNVQEVTSPGGIKAWLIEDHSMPLIAVGIGFHGGSALDPAGKEGLATFVSATLDEGAGELSSREFQQRLNDLSIDFSFDAGIDDFTGNMRTLTDRPRPGLRPAAPGAHRAALRRRAGGAHARPAAGDPRRRFQRARLDRRPGLVAHGLSGPSLWPPDRRHDGRREGDHGRRPARLREEPLRPRQPHPRRGRRHHRRRSEAAARPHLRRPAGGGRRDCGQRGQAGGGGRRHCGRPRRCRRAWCCSAPTASSARIPISTPPM